MHTVYEKLILTDYLNLPLVIREALIAQPAAQLRVWSEKDALVLASPELPWERAPVAFIPKLGIKTWRDSGSLNVLHKGLPLAPKLKALLRAPTRQQRLALLAFDETRTAPVLYLIPYVDFSHISEARALVSRGRAEFTSSCLRGESAPAFDAARPRLRAVAERLARAIELERCLLDLALMPDGRIMLVEVNPALTPDELALLTRRLDTPKAA